MTKVVLIAAYLAVSIWNAGALNADYRARHPIIDSRTAREMVGTSVLFGLLPQMIIATPFITGFYQDGWTLDWRPTTAKE